VIASGFHGIKPGGEAVIEADAAVHEGNLL